MERYFIVYFEITKGLGPETFIKPISVGLDDISDESDDQVKAFAIEEAERPLYNSEDYPLYGKNWIVRNVEEA